MLCEELGDVLLQVVFHARMAEEAGGFNFDDVCDGICQKLILRHPHIFGDVVAKTSKQVLNNWDEIKKKEQGQKIDKKDF
jgi:tetrapyrrole methylase family protein/MazG family protein